MKTHILVFLIFSSSFIFCQTNASKSISVNGSSSYVVTPKNIKIEFSISDIQPNEYRKTRYKKQIDVFNEFKEKLTQIGINNTLIVSDNFQNNYYENQNFETENYIIIVKDKPEAKKIVKNLNEGVKIKSINYLYEPINSATKDSEISRAIKDAKDKATLIAKKVNKKVGEVITIDFLTDNEFPLESTTLLEDMKTSVNITFELL